MILGSTLATASSANAATRVRHYAGHTSSGEWIWFSTTVRDGSVSLREIEIDGTATCDDGTGFSFSHDLGFGGHGPELTDGRFDLQDVFFTDALLISGRLGSRGGSGSVTHLFASLDASEAPQLCSTGSLTWSVERTHEPRVPEPATIETTAVVDGVRVTTRLGTDGASTLASTRVRPRSYEGRLSSGDRFLAVTAKHDDAVLLHELGFGWDLGCEDGTSIGLGFFILFSGVPQDPARLDLDLAAFPGSPLALHIHGRLGTHAGSGDTATTMAALTADLQAQACGTGPLTWRAWRTDPGA